MGFGQCLENGPKLGTKWVSTHCSPLSMPVFWHFLPTFGQQDTNHNALKVNETQMRIASAVACTGPTLRKYMKTVNGEIVL